MLVWLIDSRSEDEQGVNIVIGRDIASCIMDTQNSFHNLLSSAKYVTLYRIIATFWR